MVTQKLFCRLTFFSSVVFFVIALSKYKEILPYHICAALFSYICFIVCVVCSLAARICEKFSIRHAIAACDAGLLFAVETLLTGSFWAYRAWGTAFVLEPRLTGMLLMTLCFASWRIACAIIGTATPIYQKLTASLIIIGLPAMALTHFAVRLFGGIHPESIAQSGSPSPGIVPFVTIAAAHALFAASFALFHKK